MNITAFEYEDSIIVVDCGLSFPEDDMLGRPCHPGCHLSERKYFKVKGFVSPMDMRIISVLFLIY